MQLTSDWATPDNRTLVYLNESVRKVLSQHIQRTSSDAESGGILLGHVRGPHLEIIEATCPSPCDERYRFLFVRMQDVHNELADRRWRNSDGTVRYIGEWHTHPEDYPSPSALDRREWINLALKRKDQRPLLALIVGREGMYLELVSPNNTHTRLQPV